MKRSLLALGALLALAVLGPCSETASARKATHRPAWLQKLVADLEAQPVANPPASIVQYEHGGAVFYYQPPRCCDVPGVFYDSEGRRVCSPDGGFTGRGDGRCPEGLKNLRDGKVVWRDPRSGR